MNDKKLGGGLSACPKAARKTADIVIAVVRWFILLAIGYIVIYPLFYMITSSLSSRSSLLDPTSVWIPKELTLDNFKFMWEVMDYGKAFLSTVRVELVSALIEVLTCAIVAYGFARFRFPGKRLMTAALFLTILIPAPMIIIPLMMNFSHLDLFGILSLVKTLGGPDLRLNLLGTSWTFWLPSLFANGLRAGIMIYIYIQFFKGLPGELEEAAWMDGAGPIRTFFSIAVPSSSVVNPHGHGVLHHLALERFFPGHHVHGYRLSPERDHEQAGGAADLQECLPGLRTGRRDWPISWPPA